MADFQRLSEIIAAMRRTPGRHGDIYLRKIYAELPPQAKAPQSGTLQLDGIDRELLRAMGIEA